MNLLYALIFKQSLKTNSNKMKGKNKPGLIILKNIFLMICVVFSFIFKAICKKVTYKKVTQSIVDKNVIDLNEYRIKKAK